jgi:hypothetical protein
MTGLPTLRDYKGAVITVECRRCDRRAELDRKALVKQFTASLPFHQLRRRLSAGCERMNSEDGIDRCETKFPGLLKGALSFRKEND